MKTHKIAVLILLCFNILIGFSQEKTRRQLRSEKNLEKQTAIEKLIEAKEFQFVARNSNSQTFRMIDLSIIPNFVKFNPDFIKSEMPFFGRGFSGLGYGGSDTGLKFEGKPERFLISKVKKGYQIDVTVKGQQDLFNMTLFVSFQGSSTLTIISNNRESISYFGEISAIEKENK
ncbi:MULTISPECIES: DUF4251 domain-containing protein [Flavobacterium]|uniref:DUF4251 domain-containing protein n=1 Tax=Flavobacterium commune TaxID=1306519 RepID=A0A1D9P6G8_9FLAO|nr:MULTISPECIES: DUF4251 domain-containing protein [Flavobacterium]AOZ98196.1 hypothetical protein BIW12_01365 [Flavobacterium commune]